MPVNEQRERMRLMRSLVKERNVYRWAGHILLDAAQYRKRRRVLDLVEQRPLDA
jgi:trehalose 6-phosphate synthase